MTPLRLERREPARNRQRFYAITVTRTRFGSWALVREWGRIGPPGTVREMGFNSTTTDHSMVSTVSLVSNNATLAVVTILPPNPAPEP
jgi:predicted DNA-binding WGR domain protein